MIAEYKRLCSGVVEKSRVLRVVQMARWRGMLLHRLIIVRNTASDNYLPARLLIQTLDPRAYQLISQQSMHHPLKTIILMTLLFLS
jgi:hypothetical protein